jgi:imidazolonepropionase-like amidohydrolase
MLVWPSLRRPMRQLSVRCISRCAATALLVATAGCGAGPARVETAASEQRIGAPAPSLRVAGPSYAFVNGQWFTGTGFRRGTLYAVNGVFEDRPPARVDSTIDLAGGFVVPPFGDAHTHNLDAPSSVDALREAYVREGTFYVQVLTNSRSGADAARAQFNRPCALDVAYANGGLTSTLSHPFLAYEPFAMGLFNPREWRAHAAEIRKSRLRENNAYWFIDTEADVDAKWPRILAGHPDLIKIFLLDASESAPAPADTGLPSGHGLKPSLVPEIVQRAHAVGLRVAAHVETAKDFEIAARAGVDIFAHLPGYAMTREERADLREIGETAARLAGERGVVVTPTATISLAAPGPDSAASVERRRDLQRRNLTLLMKQGARVAVGSDWYGQTAWREIEALRNLGLWDNLGLLRLWAEATPQAIFPTRRLGRLEPGYEASFLVVAEDPLRRLEALRDIKLRVKQGCVVHTPSG